MPGRTLLPALLVASLGAAPGCVSHGNRLTPGEQNTFGTRTFAAPLAATFVAARAALPALGYTVTFADAASGRIATARRPAGARVSIGIDGRSSSPLYLQYDLRLVPVDATHTRVVATPHMYEGARDISSSSSWVLEGDQGLHSQWRALFQQIEAGL